MKKALLSLLLLTSMFIAWGQKKGTPPPPRQPLTHSLYDDWKEIPYKAITPDGNFAAIVVNPQDGDGKAIFYNLKTNAQDSIKRASDINLSFDSQYALFKIKPQQKIVKDLRRQKKKKEDLPKDSLGIYSFTSRKTEKIADVRSFKVPEKAGGWMAYQLDVKKEVKSKTDQVKAPADTTSKKKNAKPKKIKKNTDDNGYTLVLRKFADGKELSFGFVKDYLFAKHGQGLLFTSTGNDSTMKAGVYWYDLANGKLQALYEGKSKYKFKGLSIDEAGQQTSFLVDTDTTKAAIHPFKLYYWKSDLPAAKEMDVAKTLGIPANWLVSENYTPYFAKDGTKLFFGSSPRPVVQDTLLLPEEIVNVEVWHSEDEYIYPQQNKQLDNEKKRSYLAAIDLGTNTVYQIATKDVPSMEIGNEGISSVLLGESDIPYRKMITWDPSGFADFYIYDFQTQVRKNIASKIKGNARLSPITKYVYWYNLQDSAWFTYSIADGKPYNITSSIKQRFGDEEEDMPDYPSPYGAAGFTKDDKDFLVYDRYDIWSVDPENKRAPVNVTKIGRQSKVVFRYVRLDVEDRFINPEKELLLTAFDETTKASGYYKLNLIDGKLTKLLMDNYRFGGLVKAKNASQILYTRESFREFPDVWSSDINFTSPKKITNANPQMKKYLWGDVELVNWVSLDNIPLQGLLYKPDGFDPKKKYPLMVYFYERNSDNIHVHSAPAPYRSTINYTLYTSSGYLVFVPDIVYKVGFPGESAHNCILPGVTSLIAKGFVDEKHIGVQGHSWGGYQTAYLITRTNLFAAAEAGAPVSNMISAYGGIRWESGLSRMFQYEKSQSRIGGTLWEKPMLYIENSPIFFADKIKTPLLMMHNDGDGAVPWYQGIEYYMALRRLGKPVWMLNYNNQGHGLTQRQDKTDFAIRMKQFFDHYLKDAPEPDWMKKGVPAIEKGITKGY